MWKLILIFAMNGQPGVTSEQIGGFKSEPECYYSGDSMQKQSKGQEAHVVGFQCVPIDAISIDLKRLEMKVKEQRENSEGPKVQQEGE